MRALTTTLPLLMVFAVQAQNWALINPDYRYNYSNDGTDTIRNQIRVMHIDTLGVDSFRYELNRVIKVCDTCSGSQLQLLLNEPQFMQRKVDVGPTVWHFHDPGSFVLFPHANLAESWIFDTLANISATVSAVDMAQVFGNDVQRKVISLSNGDSIVISEPYGVLSWNDQQLIGAHGPNVGRLIPSLEEIFPFHSGDAVEYSIDAGGTDGFSSNFGHGRLYKFTVDSGTPGNGAMVFDGTMVDHRWQWTSYWNGPVYVTYGHQTLLGNTWVAGRPELPWADLLTSYPGQLIGYANDLEWWSDTMVCVAQHGLDEQGHYTFRCKLIEDPLNGPGHFMGPPPDPSTTAPVPMAVRNYCNGAPEEECGVLYTTGTGLNWLRGNYFESFEEYVLAGSIINGDTIGMVHSDDYIIGLSVGERATNPSTIVPNPASDRIMLTNATAGSAVRITDVNGRMVLVRRIASGNETIDVLALQPGAYVLVTDGLVPQRFMIVR